VELPADLPAVVPSVGVFGLLFYLVIHVMRQAAGDRGDYQAALGRLREQHAAEIREITSRHDGEIADLRTQMAGLRAEVDNLRTRLEDERRARWIAEDAAARYRRMTGGGDDEGA
jgi:predicted  nucleic acid-binding Zn-ribbon protein